MPAKPAFYSGLINTTRSYPSHLACLQLLQYSPRCLDALLTLPHSQGIPIIGYLEDLLLTAQFIQTWSVNVHQTMQTLQWFGGVLKFFHDGSGLYECLLWGSLVCLIVFQTVAAQHFGWVGPTGKFSRQSPVPDAQEWAVLGLGVNESVAGVWKSLTMDASLTS